HPGKTRSAADNRSARPSSNFFKQKPPNQNRAQTLPPPTPPPMASPSTIFLSSILSALILTRLSLATEVRYCEKAISGGKLDIDVAYHFCDYLSFFSWIHLQSLMLVRPCGVLQLGCPFLPRLRFW
ncbi:hypothetical protein AKJ16_DCAP17391, partial [Drosera capensis]